MKTIDNNTAIRLSNWAINEVAMVKDMGVMDFYKEHVTDEDRIYGHPKPCFLCSDTSKYERIEAEYANPIIVEDGELVRLGANGKIYKVVCMGRNGSYDFFSDLLHFELQK